MSRKPRTGGDKPLQPPPAAQVVAGVRAAFDSGATRPLAWRRAQLEALDRMFADNTQRFRDALYADLRRAAIETDFAEIEFVRNEIGEAHAHLDKWAATERPRKAAMWVLDTVEIRKEPKGVALIIGAWNYPIQLGVAPLVPAIAAGNAAVVKPSELAPHVADLFAELIPKYLDKSAFKVVLGGIPETTELLACKFDHIFYTGNGVVAKIIMAAAAKHLTPVTLELGGKSPVYIHDDAHLENAAQRIVYGRFLNSGQTCIAPDYVLCHEKVLVPFLEKVKAAIKKFYGENAQEAEFYARIINERHFNRLKSLYDRQLSQSPNCVVIGGEFDEKDLYIAPTVLEFESAEPPKSAKAAQWAVMEDEIFGPFLPVMPVRSPEEAVKYINSRDKPLALYPFSPTRAVYEKIIQNTNSGGVLVNDCILHIAVNSAPFGGVGESGLGNYHGVYGFNTFSHLRTTLIRSQHFEFLNTLRYPPYTYAAALVKLMQTRIRPPWMRLLIRLLSWRLLILVIAIAIPLILRK